MTSKYGKVIDGHVKEQFHKTLIGFSFGSVFGFIVGMLVMVMYGKEHLF
jgi:ABC-type nitrate/sulfonate/bicarbonate transport system permease component